MNTKQDNSFIRGMILNARNITVIDDGVFMFAIETDTLDHWEKEHGKISNQDSFEDFCHDTTYIGEKLIGTAGNKEQIDFCMNLINNGASIRSLVN
jgi:hypothetical protein